MQNVKVGQWTSWYEDGTLESEQLYLEDANLIYGLIQKDKKIKSLFTAQVSGRILGYNGIRNGRNVWYHENGQKSSEEIYKNGKIVEARFWDDQGKEMKVNIKDDYSNEEHPGIINGDVNTFLAQNIQYPREARDGGISGRVLIKFKIRKNGLLDDFHVERSSGNEALDNEAMRVVKLMNGRFRPMVSHNRRQETNYMLPVSFKISRN